MKKNDALSLISIRGAEVVRFGQLIAPEGTSIHHKVKFGGGSFTDGKNMETGLFEFMVDEAEDELNPKFTPALGLYSLKGLTAHEYGHVWFTKFKEFKKFQEKMVVKFEADGIQARLGAKIAAHVFNITEDGRIEKRMGNMYPGLVNYFRYNNGTIWQMDAEQVPSKINPETGVEEKELDNFLRCLITYSVVGLRPRWYKGTKGSELRDEVEKVLPIIDDCIDASTCRKNCDKTEELFETAWDYIIKLLKQLQDDEERLEDYMNGEGEGAGAGGTGDFGEGTSGEGDGTSAGDGDGSVRLSGKSGETGDNSGSSYSSSGDKNEEQDYSDTFDMAEGEAARGRENISHDGSGSTKVVKSKETLPEAPKSAEELVSEVTEGVKTTAAKEASSSSEAPKKTAPEASTSMTSEEVSRMCGEVGYDNESIRTYIEKRDKYSMIPIPDTLRPAASRFKRKVVRCFKEKNSKITKMTTGKLDMRLLHKVAMDEYNVFTKDLNKSNVDAVVEICWDGSGSMCGGKQNYSGQACAIVEEGLKGLVPLKIINFSTDWKHVIHYLVKDFNDKDRSVNYAMSYTKSKGFNGGNKDGYSIRVCTQDLLKRPEKDKILIVMSDGLPTDYNSINPEDDVKDAVKQARKRGIIVIPIFFGDERFRESSFNEYEYMYEKFIINSAPEELPDRLVKLLEKLVLR